MTLDELRSVITNAGGAENALAYAEALLTKINRLGATKGCEAVLQQLHAPREQGDFRGRVFEVNLIDAFLDQGQALSYAVKQGGTGDIDLYWSTGTVEVFIELKLLCQDQATRESINQQLAAVGQSSTIITDDTRDLARIQLDLFKKSTVAKFSPKPRSAWVNLVGIDVSELQLGMIDVCDCLVAAGGNGVAARYCHEVTLRPNVVGFFERPTSLSEKQKEWAARLHVIPAGQLDPRNYIHGVLFLFRKPKETAALAYKLAGIVVWNPALVVHDVAKRVEEALAAVIPAPNR